MQEAQLFVKKAESVGNAVPGVPSGAVRKHRARKINRTAACGGRNAGDGVPYIGYWS